MTATVLAVESSCDETAAAVVCGRTVLSSVVASQADLHERFGGVVPEVASRRHLEVVDLVIADALARAGIDHSAAGPGRAPVGIDAVAVTRGPGLIGALLVGLAAAKARAWAWRVPLIPVDHLIGHVASALLAGDDIEPPFTCLLVSGGHTMLLDVGPALELTLLGTTRDDAAGEAFDKGARLLGLGMPGGPALERLAAAGDPGAIAFTPAMVHQPTLDTSFAGLKTALAVAIRERTSASAEDLAAGFQQAAVATLVAMVRKLLADAARRRDTLALVGGVAANSLLRSEVDAECARHGVRSVAVPLAYCGDNAAMIGVASAYSRPVNREELARIDAYPGSALFSSGTSMPTDGTR